MLIQPLTGVFKFTPQTPSTNYDYDYICAVYSQNQSNLLTQKVNGELGIDCVCRVEIIYDGTQIKENGVTVEVIYENVQTVEVLTEYLEGLGYINITVNEKTA